MHSLQYSIHHTMKGYGPSPCSILDIFPIHPVDAQMMEFEVCATHNLYIVHASHALTMDIHNLAVPMCAWYTW